MKKLISENTIPVRWTDMDSYQHVNNARYFDYITETRHEWLVKPYLPNQQERFFLVDVECSFKKAVNYPDTITAKQYIEQVGTSSFILHYEFFNCAQELCAKGKATIVTLEEKSLRPTPIPDYLKNQFSNLTQTKSSIKKLNLENFSLLNTKSIYLRWVDMDAFGHVNNARYFDFMAETRHSLLPNSDIRNELCLFFLAKSRCAFYKPLYYPNSILIKQYLLKTGTASFEFAYQFFRKGEETLYAEGLVTLVCVDLKTYKPIPVAKQLMERFLVSK